MGAFEHRTGLRPMTTAKSTTATAAVAFTPTFDGRRVSSVKVSIEFQRTSGDIEVRVFQQTSDDGVTHHRVCFRTPVDF